MYVVYLYIFPRFMYVYFLAIFDYSLIASFSFTYARYDFLYVC